MGSFVKMTNSLSDVKVTSGFLDSFSIRLLGHLCAALFTIYLASSPSLTTVNERLTTVNEREYESSFSLWKFHHRARLRQGNISTAANSRFRLFGHCEFRHCSGAPNLV